MQDKLIFRKVVIRAYTQIDKLFNKIKCGTIFVDKSENNIIIYINNTTYYELCDLEDLADLDNILNELLKGSWNLRKLKENTFYWYSKTEFTYTTYKQEEIQNWVLKNEIMRKVKL